MKKRILKTLFFGLFSLFTVSLYAQVNVSGTVKSDAGELLPGVSIIVKGTNTGVVTNIDGNYSISAPNAQSVLVFSFVGMQPQEVLVNGRTTVDVTMITSSIGVDEVVVTALGISREKKSLGYSVSSVGGEDLSQAGNVNMLKSLDGRVTGVNIVSLSPDPTSSALITVRGATSIAGIQGKDQSNRSQPLYVIDGIPVGSGNVGKLGGIDVGNKMSQLNPNDIETITVLKGASAGALYGSEAGNGVILITTKNGAKSKKGIGVEVVSSTTFESAYKTMPVQNNYFQGERYDSEYYSMEGVSSWGALAGSEEAAKNYTQWDMLTQKYYDGPLVKRGESDRMKAFLETGNTLTNSVNITGNYDKGNYRLSFTNLSNKNVVPNNKTSRNTVSFTSAYKVVDKLTVTSSFSYTKGYTPNKSVVAGRDVRTGIVESVYAMSSNLQSLSDFKASNTWIDDYEGIYQNSPWMRQSKDPDVRTDGDAVRNNNPYWVTENNIREFATDEVFAKVELAYQIAEPLSFVLRSGGDLYSIDFEKRIPYDNRDRSKGEFESTTSKNQRINTDAILTFDKSFGKFDVTANAGYNYRYTYNTAWGFSGQNLLKPNDFRLDGLNKQTLSYLSYSGLGTGRYQSIYGTASVGFNKMLYLDITGRNDWSGITEQEVQKHFYPSASLSWLISETLDLPEWVNMLKVRSGWAQVGFGLGTQQNRNTYGFKSYSWNDASLGTVGGSLVDPEIKPEINESLEYGLEAVLFNSRLMFDFTMFSEEHKNQINTIPVVASTGFSNLMTNVGTVEAKGFEGSLTVVPVQNNDWYWSVTGNISTAESEITYMHPKFSSAWYDYADNSMQRLAVGEKIGNLYAKEGWWRVNEGPYAGMKMLKWSSGTPIENDEAANRDFLGNWNPDYIAGISTRIKYKNFSLNILGSYRKGGVYVSETTKILRDDGKSPWSVSGDHNYWEGGRVGAGGFAWPNPDNIEIDVVQNRIDESWAPYNDASYWLGVYVDPRSGADVEDRTLGNKTWTDDNGVERPYYIVNGANPNETLYNDPYSTVGNTWDFPQTRTFDATNFKLKEVSLTYSLPVAFTQKFKCQGGTFTLLARNIYFWTKSGQNEDPESAFTGTLDNQGVARFIMPQVRSVGFELNLNF